jgi:glucose/arabinose dehydrogenase
VVTLCGSLPARKAAAQPQAGFEDNVVISGLTEPTSVRFASDGRVFVAEKSGLIEVFANLSATTPTIFADLRTNVFNYWDKGLLGLELPPDFPTNPYVYVLYALDAPIGGTPPRWGTAGATSDNCPTPPGPTTNGCVVGARLSRLQAAGNVMTGSEQVLIEDWCTQFPSHTIGTVRFGPDGALYVGGGDGANFNTVDYGQFGSPLNPCGDPPGGVGATLSPPTAEGGALRAQHVQTPSVPPGYDGAILRVDPNTGAALPTNPLAGTPSDRVIAYGLRNPFRFNFQPGTNEIWIGDVGWDTWEEINRIQNPTGPVHNFGWPCYEGTGVQPGYAGAGLNLCNNLYNNPGSVTGPYFTYNHTATVVPGETCPPGSSSISGMAFYNGGSYPATYTGALFFADYSRNCIWAMLQGANGDPDPTKILTFVAGAGHPVELQIGPGGDVFYVDFTDGTIHRIQAVRGDTPPVAIIHAEPTNGPVPLTVQFDGTASYDPDTGDTITYSWDLNGDGVFGDSTLPNPTFTYTTAGPVVVSLKVTDSRGMSSVANLTLNPSRTGPTATILTPSPSLTWNVGDVINFSGSATDPQDGPLPASALTWSIVLHHCPSNCHTHPVQDFQGVASGSFAAPDHQYPSYLELILTATDSAGLFDTKSVLLYPNTVDLTFRSNPTGLSLAVNANAEATPFASTVIIGSNNTLSAPSPQTLSATTYTFSSWSDGGGQSHVAIAPATAASYVASYAVAQSTVVPPPWQDADVGAVPIAGSASYAVGVFTGMGAGSDIWDVADAFHYIYQPLTGDGEIRARVSGLENTSSWAKAGVMIRETLAPNATNAFVALTPGNGSAFQRRVVTGGTTSNTSGPAVTAPYWVRLTRAENTFSAYTSPDGAVWSFIGSDTVTMGSSVLAGLAVVSHDSTQLCTATWDHLQTAGTGFAMCGDGRVEAGEQCDLGPLNGIAGLCCDATCRWRAAGTPCRPAAGPCDVAATCSGKNSSCSADQLAAAGAVCRVAAAPCEADATCDAVTAACPANPPQPDGTPCDDGNPATLTSVCQAQVCQGVSVGLQPPPPVVRVPHKALPAAVALSVTIELPGTGGTGKTTVVLEGLASCADLPAPPAACTTKVCPKLRARRAQACGGSLGGIARRAGVPPIEPPLVPVTRTVTRSFKGSRKGVVHIKAPFNPLGALFFTQYGRLPVQGRLQINDPQGRSIRDFFRTLFLRD